MDTPYLKRIADAVEAFSGGGDFTDLEAGIGAPDDIKAADPDADASIIAAIKGQWQSLIDSLASVATVGGITVVKDVTLSLDTSAYASGDLIAETQQIDGAFRINDGTGMLQSLTVIDQDDQKMALYFIFLSANVSMGTENAAPSISDANAVNILGVVAVATTDYLDLGGVSVATIRNIALPVKAVSGTDDLYVAVVNSTGTPTYTSAGIKIRLGILQD